MCHFTHFNASLRNILNLHKLLISLAIIALLSACQLQSKEVKTASNSGFGGTGKTNEQATQVANNSGFGGTGQVASKSGFGGTGIIGTITEFGSIWVNGIEVEYKQNVKVSSNLSDKETLQLGQQVVVETSVNHKQPWTDSIHVFYPLAGLVEKVDGQEMVIDGHTVIINQQTIIADGLQTKVGSMVAVNGYPDNENRWTATRISPNPENKHVYQLTPDVTFSSQVTNVVIETHKSQLTQWNNSFSGLNIQVIENAEKIHSNPKYLLKAQVNQGKITGYHLHDYYRVVKNPKNKPESEFKHLEGHSQKGGQIKKPQEAQQAIKEQLSIIQTPLQQMRQMQALKEGIQNINELKNQLNFKR
ncbi:MAG: DUF5666 domain-containing protein [Thiomicrorhabdus sp.]|nr:DUF5666 domain-containing protein [Thiomicrorhabdus sp.]